MLPDLHSGPLIRWEDGLRHKVTFQDPEISCSFYLFSKISKFGNEGKMPKAQQMCPTTSELLLVKYLRSLEGCQPKDETTGVHSEEASQGLVILRQLAMGACTSEILVSCGIQSNPLVDLPLLLPTFFGFLCHTESLGSISDF